MIETWINIVLNLLVALFVLAGTFFILSASIGVVRFPDVYTKLHAATKASTLGIAFILIGAFTYLYLEHSIVSGKLLLAIVFIMLTAPVGAHMMGRAAHTSGVKPYLKNRNDEYEHAVKVYKKKNQ
ncbi:MULTISPECIES: monovalent cation/H(+) antiporter subunit G [Bacillota]|uniref:Cation:proton antiporter n=1 Tax=Virgibacillus pantothenticus TaxID=1473 RepID=A0A0L0QPU3_VIRPA|nr:MULTISPECIES: monovalent cation/H(+) antiporter subunit G [Bacillota]API90610.1 Na+/H+ antiporter subunit G [Virgibacillus sp. 6R]KNE20566.1 cation:proton antiporter [Virgibacillus pantothenticus]MBS7429726.1 monovalent cation/H(+) antiporter subunit G [Virgibacillus sp. 19R1-5]MED3738689.1 monovalent cation/H(+) antiporter subunit G [Virgibacillus pantothenticus]NBJ68599.1 monovalent cation/H(+) antiporter subunit G [Roseburia sp. 1XD42-34]